MENNDSHIIINEKDLFTDYTLSDKNKNISADLCEDITVDNIPDSLDEIEFQIDRLKRKWNEFTYLIGQRLKFINENHLYKEKGYHDFATYIKIALKMSENNAYYYIAVFDFFTEEQTKIAGSKLKLIIPVLNQIKKDKSLETELKNTKIDSIRNELYEKIYNKTYREAEKIIKSIRNKYFNRLPKIKKVEQIVVKSDKIIIYENNDERKNEIVQLIKDYYNIK